MKISNIERRLHNLNAQDLDIKINRTEWGWFVRMSCRLNRGYYDIEVTDQVRDREHKLNERQVLASFRAANTGTICGKPNHDESDPMSDYCAWNFYRRLNDLNYLQERQLSHV